MAYTSNYAQDSLKEHGGGKKKKVGASNSGASGSGSSGSGNKGQAPARKLSRLESNPFKKNLEAGLQRGLLGGVNTGKYSKK